MHGSSDIEDQTHSEAILTLRMKYIWRIAVLPSSIFPMQVASQCVTRTEPSG